MQPGDAAELPLPTGRDWPGIAPERGLICIEEGSIDAPACTLLLDARDAGDMAERDAADAAAAVEEALRAEAAAMALEETDAEAARADAHTAAEASIAAEEAEARARLPGPPFPLCFQVPKT